MLFKDVGDVVWGGGRQELRIGWHAMESCSQEEMVRIMEHV
jgi:hypothetical protein